MAARVEVWKNNIKGSVAYEAYEAITYIKVYG